MKIYITLRAKSHVISVVVVVRHVTSEVLLPLYPTIAPPQIMSPRFLPKFVYARFHYEMKKYSYKLVNIGSGPLFTRLTISNWLQAHRQQMSGNPRSG